MTDLIDIIVPPRALDLPDDLGRRRVILRWLEWERHRYEPNPGEIALDPDQDYAQVSLPDPDDDEARDRLLIIQPDPFPPITEHESAAYLLVDLKRDRRDGPPEWSPLRWRFLDRLLGYGYQLGITQGRGCTWDRWGRRYAIGRIRPTLPVHREHRSWDPDHPYRWRLRCYVAGRPRWWWECLWRQIRTPGHGWHRPEQPWAFDICAACCPCPECGAHQDCADDCPMAGGLA